uniref:CLUMA_CG000131, isoform A n=1 Tax=Clunio marinus TaxID=568069 RepID=A0A1J1HEG4_9DIPT|nr:CLUMA_CG000131, isoform A [Clunio marinus]
MQQAIQVYIKFRPLIPREINEGLSPVWSVKEKIIKSNDKQYEMNFDHIYDETRSTQELFNDLAKPIVSSSLKGINGTIFAYGQTSSGKTHTMMGSESSPGIIPLTVHEIFEQIENIDDREFLLRFGYIEIYNEKIYDLLLDKKPEITKVQESSNGELQVKQREIIAVSEEQILQNYEAGNQARRTGETSMNERSSRSHTIFRIVIESREAGKTSEECAVQVSSLNLVDLAGSERAVQTKAEGDRLKEGGHINKSLLALGNVIRTLMQIDSNAVYVNYRDSKLTRLLSASIGGNAMTRIICTVTPAALDETYFTLIFAQNAQAVKNRPKVNEILTEQAYIKRMEREIQVLKKQLVDEKSRVDNCLALNKIQEAINLLEKQFLHSHNVTNMKAVDVNRRRTWCPSATVNDYGALLSTAPPSNNFESRVPPFLLDHSSNKKSPSAENNDGSSSDEIFKPANEIDLDLSLTPRAYSEEDLCNMISTPKAFKHLPQQPTPIISKTITTEDYKAQIRYLEENIVELEDFKKIEIITLKQACNTLENEVKESKDQISSLLLKNEGLEKQIREKENSELEAGKMKKDCERAWNDKQLADNIVESIKYEFDEFKKRAKLREDELILSLEEARSDSKVSIIIEKNKILEENLKKTEEKLFHLQSNDEVKASMDKIKELEKSIEETKLENEKLQLKIAEKQKELVRVFKENEDISTQLVNSVEDNDILTKKVEEFEKIKYENDSNSKRCFVIEQIANNFHDETAAVETDDGNDPLIKFFIDLKLKWLQSIKNFDEVLTDAEKLRNENQNLRLKLPTIQESSKESISELRDQYDSTLLQLQEMNQHVEQQKAKLEEDKINIEKLSEELMRYVESNREMKEQIESLKQFKHETEEAASVAIINKDKLNQDIEEKDIKIKQLEDDMAAKANEMTLEIIDLKDQLKSVMSLAEDNARLKNIEKDYKRVSNEFTALKSKKEKEIEDLNFKIEEIQLENSNKNETIERLKQKNEMQYEKLQNLQHDVEENSQLKIKILDLEIHLNDLQEQLKQVEKEKMTESTSTNATEEFEALATSAITEETEELRNKLKLMEDKLATLELSLKDREMLLKGNEEVIANLTKEVEEEKASSEKTVTEKNLLEEKLNEQLSTANKYVETIQKELKEVTFSAESYFGELEVYKQKFDEIKTQLKMKEECNRILETHIADKNHEIEELQNNINNQTTNDDDKKVENLLKELSEVREKNLELEKSRSEIEDDLKNLTKEKTLIDEEQKTTIEKQTCMLNQINQQKEELGRFTSEVESLKSELDKVLADKSSLDEEFKSLQIKIDSISTELKEVKTTSKDFQSTITKLDAENTNLKSKELVIMRDIELVRQQLQERTEECEQIKLRQKRRSTDTEKIILGLEKENSKLTQTIGEIEAKKVITEKELKRLQSEYSNDVENLQIENEKLKIECSDNDVKYTILDETLSQLREEKSKLEMELMKSNKSLDKQITELREMTARKELENSNLLKTITKLTEDHEALFYQFEELKKSKKSSPEKRNELFASHNELLVLDGPHRGTPKRSTEKECQRKHRRQSVHDDNRRLSAWERFSSVDTQTDNVSEMCACSELTAKVKELQIEVRLRECKISTLERFERHNPLKLDLDDAKKMLAKEQREHKQTKSKLETISRKLSDCEIELKELEKVAKLLKEENKSSQKHGDNFVAKTEYEQIERNLDEFKRLCRQQEEKINDLESVLETKENMSKNVEKTQEIVTIKAENSILKKKIQEYEEKENQIETEDNGNEIAKVQKELDIVRKKYDMARRICALRLDDMEKLKADVTSLSEAYEKKLIESETLAVKYQKLKTTYQKQSNKFIEMREKCNCGGDSEGGNPRN